MSSNSSYWEGSVLLIDKPLKWTSFDVVNKVRIALKLPDRKIKVGHAGTLDPLATGLLLLCTGKQTRTIDELQGMDKTYTGTITLGATTPSYDLETEPDAKFDIAHITDQDIAAAAEKLTGKLIQVPPAHSAIKIDGKRAYKLARKGREVEMPGRQITIHSFRITSIEMPMVSFEVSCSKGTYIRSLAHDFGKQLGSGAHLSSLVRTAIGSYQLEDAWQLDELVRDILEKKPAYIQNMDAQRG